jgi:hypothetical protein
VALQIAAERQGRAPRGQLGRNIMGECRVIPTWTD